MTIEPGIGEFVEASIENCPDRTKYQRVTRTMWRCLDCGMLKTWDELIDPEVVS